MIAAVAQIQSLVWERTYALGVAINNNNKANNNNSVSPRCQGNPDERELMLTEAGGSARQGCFLESGRWDVMEAAEDKWPGLSPGGICERS